MASKLSTKQSDNFKVVVRIRPPLPRELTGDTAFKNIVAVDEKEQQITVSEDIEAAFDTNSQLLVNTGGTSHTFVFDHVYDQHAPQKKVFETTARPVVDSALQGYNATIFAYGQTGTGKTFTMEGFNRDGTVETRGIIPRAIEQIFGHIQRHASPRMRFLVRASYLQIYNEAISDLLKPERSNLGIREDKRRGVYVDGLSEWVVRSPAEIYGLMQRGGAVRATGETKMNEVSSRSHAVFIVIAEQSETVYVDEQGVEMSPEEFQKFMHARGVRREHELSRLEDHIKQSFKIGKLNLVDLAGSERVRISGATGQRLEESKMINRSLSALGNVISALTDNKGRQHIPYRDSKLTRMLEDSLGGNCRTTMMAMISPALEAILETISTLKFANRAKNIRNEARVNEDLDQKSLLRKYERELKKLRAELEEKSKNVVDKRRLLELDEQRRRAEADKMAAIRALEARSLEFMREKEEKKRLEQRISMLMSQMIRGDKAIPRALDGAEKSAAKAVGAGGVGENIAAGARGGDTPELKENQEKLRKEYEDKLAGLEKERENIEEEKAQVDRYKQLLLKQRDIMIALTQRLVERDEQIMALQDELDAYDRHHKELEEKLDEKTALLIRFQRISMEVNANSPYKNTELKTAMEDWAKTNANKPAVTATEVIVEDGEDESIAVAMAPSSAENVNPTNSRLDIQSDVVPASSDSVSSTAFTDDIFLAGKIVERELMSKFRGSYSTQDIQSMLSPLYSCLRDAAVKLQKQQLPVPVNRVGSDVPTNIDTVATVKVDDEMLQRMKLESRCELLVREREAVHTIFEQKIKVLVQGVASSLGSVLQNSPSGGGPAGVALSKDVAALQRLVNASIAALRNAAAAGAGNSSSSPPISAPTIPTTANNN